MTNSKGAPKNLWALPAFSFGLHALGFLDLGRLALQGTQVVQLGAAHLAAADHFDMVHTGGMQRNVRSTPMP